MVDMNEKYAGKGLQIIGISLDEDRNKMVQVTKQKGMTWPEYFDGSGWDNKFWKQYGSNGIPFTVLVGPGGKVLYAGHPAAGLDEAIEKAFKETPPVLVDPSVMAEANEMLSQVEQKTASGDTKAAFKLLSKVPMSAKIDAAVASRFSRAAKKLEDSANSMLADVQAQIQQGKYIEAVARLKELSAGLSGIAAGSKATAMLNSLMSDPKARAAIATDERNAKADDALEAAVRLQAQKKDELAYAQFTQIVKFFAGTDGASKAQAQVSLYEQDSAFIQKVREKAASSKAVAALHMGDNYRRAGDLVTARRKYQSVVDDFPGTSYAEQAKSALDAIANQ